MKNSKLRSEDMKKIATLIVIMSFIFISVGCKKTKGVNSKIDLNSQKTKRSYAMGYNFGNNLKDLKNQLDTNALLKGISDSLEGGKALLKEEEIRKTLMEFQQEMIKKQQEKNQKIAETNKKISADFLKKNARKKGVKTTKSGLQYEIIKEGTGKTPLPTDIVVVNYRGTLLNGQEFDSSYKRGKPAEFQLNRVIPGWVEGLQLMKVGAKYRFYIPSNLAYKDRGAGNLIGPGQLLIFDVELLEIKKPSQAKN
jgi:FKBP-type peptidyl-prolyl cis-trans isomerase FklB